MSIWRFRQQTRSPQKTREKDLEPRTESRPGVFVERPYPMAKKSRNIELTQVTQWEDGSATRVEDYLAAEEPLEMRSGRYSLGVTLRTPGDDEELVAGFLFTEGIISRREDLVSLRMPSEKSPERNLVRATLAPGVRLAAGRTARRFSAGSACGVCGKAS